MVLYRQLISQFALLQLSTAYLRLSLMPCYRTSYHFLVIVSYLRQNPSTTWYNIHRADWAKFRLFTRNIPPFPLLALTVTISVNPLLHFCMPQLINLSHSVLVTTPNPMSLGGLRLFSLVKIKYLADCLTATINISCNFVGDPSQLILCPN